MPFFSIVLPTNNSLSKIEQSLSSCLSSSFSDFELMIGVQDFEAWDFDSSSFKHLLEDSRVRIVDATSAKNLPANLNILLDSISSPYAVRHDDDDLMHPLRLHHLYEQSELLEKAVVIGQAYKTIGNPFVGISGIVLPSKDDILNREHLLLGPCFAHPAVTLNMSKLQLRYDEDFTYAQDYKLYVDNFSAGLFVGLQSLATYYKVPNRNETSYHSKRIQQLAFHDRCMFELWFFLLGEDSLSPILVSEFRKSFLTSEDDKLRSTILASTSIDKSELIEIYQDLLYKLRVNWSRPFFQKPIQQAEVA